MSMVCNYKVRQYEGDVTLFKAVRNNNIFSDFFEKYFESDDVEILKNKYNGFGPYIKKIKTHIVDCSHKDICDINNSKIVAKIIREEQKII